MTTEKAKAMGMGETKRTAAENRELRSLWFGLLAPPLAWLMYLQGGYMLAALACRTGTVVWMHVATVAALALLAAGTLVSWRNWQHVGREWPGSESGPVERSRFIAVLGLIAAAFFTLLILGQWLPTFLIPPCP